MIPVTPQPEPEGFEEKVKAKGKLFLSHTTRPSSQQWQEHDYWRRALPDMRKAYNQICAYSAFWIPHATGSQSIDHFMPKSQRPDLAYEWSNFRYVSIRFNSRKGTQTILNPFTLASDWFMLDFQSFFLFPNPTLTTKQQQMVNDTIDCLKLNSDDDLVEERQNWFLEYKSGEISFDYLQKRA
ncbi:MAG: hypothetical protein AAF639_28415, partial [Chloroflexota bacterium]